VFPSTVVSASGTHPPKRHENPLKARMQIMRLRLKLLRALTEADG
jgi:hypothetical protein